MKRSIVSNEAELKGKEEKVFWSHKILCKFCGESRFDTLRSVYPTFINHFGAHVLIAELKLN